MLGSGGDTRMKLYAETILVTAMLNAEDEGAAIVLRAIQYLQMVANGLL